MNRLECTNKQKKFILYLYSKKVKKFMSDIEIMFR